MTDEPFAVRPEELRGGRRPARRRGAPAGAGPRRGCPGWWWRRPSGAPARRWPGWRRPGTPGSAALGRPGRGDRRRRSRGGGRGVRGGGRPGRRPARLPLPPVSRRRLRASCWAADPGAVAGRRGGLARGWPAPVDRRGRRAARGRAARLRGGWSGAAADGGRRPARRSARELASVRARADRGRPGAGRVRRPAGAWRRPGSPRRSPRPSGRPAGRPLGRGRGSIPPGSGPTDAGRPAPRLRRGRGPAGRARRGSRGGPGRRRPAGRAGRGPPAPAGRPPPPPGRPAARRRAGRWSARWWAGLTPAQRRWLVGHEPALVGRARRACRRPPATRPTGCGSTTAGGVAGRAATAAARVPPGRSRRSGCAGGRTAGRPGRAGRPAGGRRGAAGVPAGVGPGRRGPGGGGARRPGPGRPSADLRAGHDRRPGRRRRRAGPGGAGAGPVRRARPGRGRRGGALAGLRRPDFLHEAASAGPGPGRRRRRCTASRRGCGPPTTGRRPGRPCSGTATARWWSARPPGSTGWPPTRWSSSARPGSASTHAAELGVPPGRGLGEHRARRRDPVRPGSPDELGRRALLGAAAAGRPLLGSAGRTGHELWFGHDPCGPGLRRPGLRAAGPTAGHTRLLGPGQSRRWTADGPGRAGPLRAVSLDGDRLGQVAGLVDVVAPGGGDLAGEHLQRHGGHQRRQQGRRTRHLDQVVGVRGRPPRRPPRRSRWSGRRGPGPPGCWRRPCRAARRGRPATAPRRPPGCPRRSARSGRA